MQDVNITKLAIASTIFSIGLILASFLFKSSELWITILSIVILFIGLLFVIILIILFVISILKEKKK